MVYEVAEAMGRVVEARDPYTQGHQERVARVAKLIAQDMGLPEADVDAVEMAGLVHDIGKMCIPAEILSRPGSLSEVEKGLIRQHPQSSYDILKDIAFPWPVADIALQHHERMDGSGYPHGLTGEQTLLAARILAVADVVEAMSSHRPYRPALGLDVAMAELNEHPTLYDPQVAASCTRLYEAGTLDL
jgi:putative nucleotidyltransferase with HDIG domain